MTLFVSSRSIDSQTCSRPPSDLNCYPQFAWAYCLVYSLFHQGHSFVIIYKKYRFHCFASNFWFIHFLHELTHSTYKFIEKAWQLFPQKFRYYCPAPAISPEPVQSNFPFSSTKDLSDLIPLSSLLIWSKYPIFKAPYEKLDLSIHY